VAQRLLAVEPPLPNDDWVVIETVEPRWAGSRAEDGHQKVLALDGTEYPSCFRATAEDRSHLREGESPGHQSLG
jgi:hypothetical protein